MNEDHTNSTDWFENLTIEEMESINRGLKDFVEGRVHSHEAALEIYGKYLDDYSNAKTGIC